MKYFLHLSLSASAHLYGRRCDLPGVVEVEREHLREPRGVGVHDRAGVAERLQQGADGVQLLNWGCRGEGKEVIRIIQ